MGDRWTAEFIFGRQAPAWAFMRSNVAREDKQSWRAKSWTVLTPGVELKGIGAYDALVARNGTVPTRVRIRFTWVSDAPKGARFDRHMEFTGEDGTIRVRAEAQWAIIDKALGRPIRVSPEVVAPFLSA